MERRGVLREAPAIAGGKPVRDTFLVFGRPALQEAEIQEVIETLRSGWLGTGPRVRRFEEDFRDYIGCEHAMAVSSCTAGLHLALDVTGIGKGDEVITTPLTFPSTVNVIVHRGAHPILVDVDGETQNINPDEIEDAITPRTKAIIPVHMAGRPCEMDVIMDVARRHDLVVIEDAAHAVEAVFKGAKVGNIGDITAFSFYATKNVCTGKGGMVTTNDDKWAEEIHLKSLHGISKDAWERYSSQGFQPYETLYPGYPYYMMDIQAALGIHQLARIEENLKQRERIWQKYSRALSNMDGVLAPSDDLPSESRHARHLYAILLDLDRLRIERVEFVEAMKAENIGTGIHFTSLHTHKYYRDTFGYKPSDFPNAEWIGRRTVSLPLAPNLTNSDVQDVIAAVGKVLEWARDLKPADRR